MATFFLSQNDFNFVINVLLFQNYISLKCQSNFNNNLYSLNLTLNDFFNHHKFFQRCNSLNEIQKLFLFSFRNNNAFIRSFTNLTIVLGVYIENECIFFSLDSDNLYNINKPFQNPNECFAFIKSLNSSSSMNPMVKSRKNIQINEIKGGIPEEIIENPGDNLNQNYKDNNLNKNMNYNNNMNYNMNYNMNNNMNYNMNNNMNYNMNNNMNYNMNNNMNYNMNYNNNNNIMNYNNNNNIMNYNMNNNMNYNNKMNYNNNMNYNNKMNYNNNMNYHNNMNNNNNINNNNNMNNNNIINNMNNDQGNNYNAGKSSNSFSIFKESQSHNYINIDNNNSLVKYRILKNENKISFETKELKGLLNFCFSKKLANKLEDINGVEIILSEKMKIPEIISILKDYIHLTGEDNKDLIENDNIINILNIYKYYFNEPLKKQVINVLLQECLKKEERKDLKNSLKYLSKYESHYTYFDKQFFKDLKKCRFDYSLISINILGCDTNHAEEYTKKKEECSNLKKKIVYYPTNIDPISKKNEDELKYAPKSDWGKGFYFLDSIDLFAIESSSDNNGDYKYGINLPINSPFSIAAFEIFYDETKLTLINDSNKINYENKKVEPNGLHIINMSNDDKFKLLFNSCCTQYSQYKEMGESLFNEYIISENYQIFPLYTLTLKRNEYFVLWRDPNFKGENEYSQFLKSIESSAKTSNMNFYFESSTEEALKFLIKRKYDKPIIITSIGKDLSGKRFIEIARKILGFDIMVLFFSVNSDHLSWIQNFDNCLYTNDPQIYLKYINNYNTSGLKELKSIVENKYNIKLKPFPFDSLLYVKNKEDFNLLNNYSDYMRHVNIKNGDKYLCMEKDGKVNMSNDPCPWDITLLGNEITLFSNGFYLDLSEDKENLVGYPYMKYWDFQTEKGYFYFINKESKNIISVEGMEVKANKSIANKNELFELIDVAEE